MYLSTTQVSFLFDIMAIAIGLTITCCLTYYATMINNLNVAYYSKLDRVSSLLSQIPLVYKYLVKKKSVHQNLIFVITLTALGLSLRFTSTLFFHLTEPVLFIANSRLTMSSISPLYNISGWTGGFTQNNTGIQSLTQYLTSNNRTLLDQTIKIDRVPFVNDSSANNSIPYARNIIGLSNQLEPSLYFDNAYSNATAEFSDGNTTMFATLIGDANAVFPYADLRLLTGLLLTNPDDSGNSGYAPYVWASPSMLLWQSTSTVYPYMSVKDSGLYAHNPTNSTLIIVSKNSAISICTPYLDIITREQCLRSGVSMEESFIQKCSAYFNRTKTTADDFNWESLCVEWREQDGAYTINIIDRTDSYKKLQITYNMYYSEEVRQTLDPKIGFTPLTDLDMSTYSGDILFLQQLFVPNPANTTHAGSHQYVYTTPFDNDLVNEPFLESLLDWFGAGCSLTDCDEGQMVLEYASGYEGTGLLIATCVALLIAICTIPLNWIKKYSLFNQHIIDTVSRTIDHSNEDSSSNWNRDFYYWRLTSGDEMHLAVTVNDLGQLTAKKFSEVELKESTPLHDYKA